VTARALLLPVALALCAGTARAALLAGPRQATLRRLPHPSPIVARRRRSETQRSLLLLRAPKGLESTLARAAVPFDPERVATAWALGVVAAGALGTVLGGPWLGAILGGVGVAVPALALYGARGRSAAQVRAALPGLLEATARSLRSGASLLQAVREASADTDGPLRRELARTLAETDRGTSLGVALEHLGERRAGAEVQLAVAALRLGHEAGGQQARALDGLAAALRDADALAREIRALSSQARLSALVIGIAPVGFAAFTVMADQDSGRFLLGTAGGRAILAGGLLLNGAGWLWMRRLCRPDR